MRIVYVAGFFKHVLPELQKRVSEHLKSGAVVWIPQYGNTDELNVNRFKGALFDAANRGATDILVCLFIMRGNITLRPIIDAIIEAGKSKYQNLEVRIEPFKSARDADGVIEKIEAFSPDAQFQFPGSLDEVAHWVSERHPEKIVLHPRAIGGAKKSRYQDVPLVYSALDLLATEYWNMRTSQPEFASKNREQCEARLQKLGLELSLSITPSRAGEQGAEYFVFYPLGSQHKKLLEHHLRKGADRDERFALRIYFFWDERIKKVVIGWLPSHLDTRST